MSKQCVMKIFGIYSHLPALLPYMLLSLHPTHPSVFMLSWIHSSPDKSTASLLSLNRKSKSASTTQPWLHPLLPSPQGLRLLSLLSLAPVVASDGWWSPPPPASPASAAGSANCCQSPNADVLLHPDDRQGFRVLPGCSAVAGALAVLSSVRPETCCMVPWACSSYIC